MTFDDMNELVEKYVPLVNSDIYDVVKGAPEELYNASLHLIKAGGKRLRPLVVLATARALGGVDAEARAIPLASAVEIFHNFTLVHDDIMDNDDFRRGVPTVHKVYGVPLAITAGDLMFSLSFASILRSLEKGLDEEYVIKAVQALTEASRKVAEGQGYDMLFERSWNVDAEDYLRMIYLKTGALVEASAKLGAIAAKAKDEVIETMGEYGRLVGLAFQIRDDILGVFGDPSKTGKPVYSDLRRGKKTILALKAASSNEKVKELLIDIFNGDSSEEKLKEAAEAIKSTGALDYAQGLANSYSRLAVEKLDMLKASGLIVDEKAYRALRDLAVFSAQREK
ncbi:Farnesylgeranyl diphosphate synthase [Acidilobus saccharovorans 345-15]|uniref:Farnesylgeranyl diphosphate synthase n=1 Tax=Acidilobus saccharovorans (strain DSM 16705 / JCM 18335 / VKM B-2471 / 345-15) TaxID=666510 RepID=D9Q0A1_ACIS3|nr:polyprenyl synthetase family protein [Acidilobus saccharovorans]ADL18739.1 Farnesylgeranyl diphosphate synthase [Acidilobus saccharovorans 345-15]